MGTGVEVEFGVCIEFGVCTVVWVGVVETKDDDDNVISVRLFRSAALHDESVTLTNSMNIAAVHFLICTFPTESMFY